jgi:hypothetical protein
MTASVPPFLDLVITVYSMELDVPDMLISLSFWGWLLLEAR